MFDRDMGQNIVLSRGSFLFTRQEIRSWTITSCIEGRYLFKSLLYRTDLFHLVTFISCLHLKNYIESLKMATTSVKPISMDTV